MEDASTITVTLNDDDSTQYTAELVGSDSRTDLAVIKIDATGLTPATLGDSSTLVVGQVAIAIGNPLQLGGTVTTGIISALSRTLTVNGQTMTLLQTDAAVNPGNSGGGLFDTDGNLIGIVNARADDSSESISGLGFAIPINTAKEVITSLIENGYVTGRAALGITALQITSQSEAQQYGVDSVGVYVAGLTEGSNAEAGGLQVGDRIVSIDGQEVTENYDIQVILENYSVGDTVTVTVERNGTTVDCEVVLSEL
ncbi:MAG: S1C family serine protease, partial [Oscillospiraceae bacterium]